MRREKGLMAELFEWPVPEQDAERAGQGGDADAPPTFTAEVLPDQAASPEQAVLPEQTAPDWRERQRALDISRSWIVEAPAGSGKTGLLIQRYLKLLAEGRVERPEQVLAITFTRAATEEVRERLISELEGAAADEPAGMGGPSPRAGAGGAFERLTRDLARAVLQRDAELGWRLLESPRRLNVRTIDSVCAEIARALPVTSGGNAALLPVEEPGVLHREAARRTLMQMGGEDRVLDDALRTVLLQRDGSLAECERLLAEMLAARDQWGELVPLGCEALTEEWLEGTVRRRLNRALELVVCQGLTELARAIPEDTLNEITILAAEMGHAPALGSGPSPMAVCAGITSAPGEGLDHLEHWQALIHLLVKADGEWRAGFRSDWLRFTWDRQHTTPMKGLIASLEEEAGALRAIKGFHRLPPARYPEEQWLVAKALFRVLSRALVELQMVFAERGESDFVEPALQARAALRQERGVKGYESTLGTELRHLLVDEMQDTSTSQYELIELLTEGWNSDGRTVFLVGDPKQSIYLFRQARVERFVRTMQTERMGRLRLGRLRLTANFRSQAGLVEGFNEDFGRVFPAGGGVPEGEVSDGEASDGQASDGGLDVEVPFVAAQAVRGRGEGLAGDDGVAWHAGVAHGTREEAGEGKRAAARSNARKIREVAERWRARPLPRGRTEPWKIAVLVRSRRELREIVAAMKRDEGRGALPFRAVKVEPLKEQREVLDLLALTRALQHPMDRAAWWAVLRAPWCGLGLADLHVLAGEDDRQMAQRTVMELVRTRGELLPTSSIERLERVWPVLEAAAERRSRLRLPELVERTWRSLGGDAALTAAELGNAVRFLELLDELDRGEGGGGDGMEPGQMQRALGRLYAEAGTEAAAVELMTIHGAKGLEWDVVMVPELERKAPPARARLFEWEEMVSEEEGAAGVILAPIAGRGEAAAALNRWLRGIRCAREAAERRRLFYVACTRAREELHLFGTANRLKDGTLKAEGGSLLEAAWPAAEVRFRGESARVLEFPGPAMGEVLDLAAAAEDGGEEMRPAVLERLPASFDPALRFRRPGGGGRERAEGMPQQHFARPEGSFAARSFGNAVHAFLELAAGRLEAGLGERELGAEVSGWKDRATAVLRSDGLPRAVVERLAGRVLLAVLNTLREPEGRWLLGAGKGAGMAAEKDARSEYALTMWGAEGWSRVRMDRVFWAGSSPGAEGAEFLWIIDYKTGSHGAEGVEAFLEREQAKYAAQMERYARASGTEEVGVGLWYPLVGRLVWWVVGGSGGGD